MMIYMMTGAPRMGVTALSGSIPVSPGSVQRRLQSRAVALPVSIVTGISVLWLEVPSRRRAMWGTARPMNEIGPQKAVVTAVNRPTVTNSMFLTRWVLMPRFSAYRLPNSSALRGLINKVASSSPMEMEVMKNGICSEETAPKLPIPHIM